MIWTVTRLFTRIKRIEFTREDGKISTILRMKDFPNARLGGQYQWDDDEDYLVPVHMIWTVTRLFTWGAFEYVEFTREDGYVSVLRQMEFPDAKEGDKYQWDEKEDNLVLVIPKTVIEVEL